MLLIAQIVVTVLLIAVILMQSRGTGLGSTGSGQSYHSRRGMEKVLFRATIGLTVVFIVLSLLPLLGVA